MVGMALVLPNDSYVTIKEFIETVQLHGGRDYMRKFYGLKVSLNSYIQYDLRYIF